MLDNLVSENKNLDLEVNSKLPEFKGKQHQLPLPQYPKLAASVNSYQNRIIFSQSGRDFAFEINYQTGEIIKKILMMMDGTNSLSKLQQMFSPKNAEFINTLVHYLDTNKLLDEVFHLKTESFLDVLLELEDLSDKVINNKVIQNTFKFNQLDSDNVQLKVIYGFAIEVYHFLSRKICIDSSLLNFQSSTHIQELVSQIYTEECGQDKLLIEALNYLGINNEDLIDTIPLPQTTSLCNTLAYWASFDSLFYLSIFGILAKQNLSNLNYYFQACESLEIDSSFLEPIKILIKKQQNSDVKNIIRKIYQDISQVDKPTKQRLKAQMYLFGEIYTNFYTAIFNYYSSTETLLRRVSAI